MFLKLASELNGIQDCKNFMDYWEKIPELGLKEQGSSTIPYLSAIETQQEKLNQKWKVH